MDIPTGIFSLLQFLLKRNGEKDLKQPPDAVLSLFENAFEIRVKRLQKSPTSFGRKIIQS